MRLFSYIVTVDSGFAPNPFGRYCTLACCKPRIRATAEKDDWVIGLSSNSKESGNKMIFAMKITMPPLTFDDYFRDKRFEYKKPNMEHKNIIFHRGDNIYEPNRTGYQQLWSEHNRKKGSENLETKTRDLSSKNVLVSSHFYYFGEDMQNLPEKLKFLIVGIGHRCHFTEEQKNTFLNFIMKKKTGIYASPNKWSDNDSSWRIKCL